MSEPAIIDYYNDLPNGVYVIEKLNIEYNNLEEKYNELEKKYNELKEEQKYTLDELMKIIQMFIVKFY